MSAAGSTRALSIEPAAVRDVSALLRAGLALIVVDPRCGIVHTSEVPIASTRPPHQAVAGLVPAVRPAECLRSTRRRHRVLVHDDDNPAVGARSGSDRGAGPRVHLSGVREQGAHRPAAANDLGNTGQPVDRDRSPARPLRRRRSVGPHLTITTSVKNGGQSDHVRHLVNHQSCEGSGHDARFRVITELGQEAYHDRVCDELGLRFVGRRR